MRIAAEEELCAVCGTPAEYAIEEEGGKILYRCRHHALLGFAIGALLQSLAEHLAPVVGPTKNETEGGSHGRADPVPAVQDL